VTRPVRARRLTARWARPRRPGRQAGPHVAIEVHTTAAVTTVVIRGDLDVTSTPRLAAQLTAVLAGRPRRLVFDLAQVGFIDCAAARLIAGTSRWLPGRPVIRSPGRLVCRVLELTGMDGHCDIEMPGLQPPAQHL
jgi:anti-anti-sigma factor